MFSGRFLVVEIKSEIKLLNTKNLKYVPSPIDDEWEEVDEYIGES